MKEEETHSAVKKVIDDQMQGKGLLWKILTLIKWIASGIVTGLIVGAVATAFSYGIRYVTAFRIAHDWIIFFLPAAGVFIVFFYHLLKDYQDSGTNLVIAAIQKDEELPLKKTPLIFVSTIVTHLFGGSAGRESAALQIGGSLGFNLGKLFRFSDDDKKILTMCGMSAAFSALFGTPLAAAFLSIEIESVGILYYAALVPCALSALTADSLGKFLGLSGEKFTVSYTPGFNVYHAFFAALLAVLCALLSIAFCVVLKKTSQIFQKLFASQYVRIFAGGCILVALTMLSGTRAYNGAGMDIIALAVQGRAPHLAFLFKILFTAVTLEAGYKGGEIVPALYIGATFGCLYSQIGGFSPALCAAIGMGALFCGVTNCPVSSLLLCFEMFGYSAMPYYLIAIALSYTFSGYYSVYSSQKIVYSKFRNKYINHPAE